MRRFFIFLLCGGTMLCAQGQEPYSTPPQAPLFLADDDTILPAQPLEPTAANDDSTVLPATAVPPPKPKPKPKPKAAPPQKPAPPPTPKPAPAPQTDDDDEEMVLYATPAEPSPPPPPSPEIILSATPLPPAEPILPALPAPVVVVPPPVEPKPAPKISISLPALPIVFAPPVKEVEADHGPIYDLLKTHYFDQALFRSAGLDKTPVDDIPKELFRLPGVRLVSAVEPETHPPLRSTLLPDRIGYWRAAGLTAPKGGWSHLGHELRDWNHGGPAEALSGMVLDLRGTTAPSDFTGAARIASFFIRPNKFLFSLDGPQTALKFYQTEDGDETGTVYDGPLIVLVDAGTRGAAEALADVLRRQRNAILVGQATAGEAALFSPFPVGKNGVLVIPVAAVRRPDDHAFFNEPVTPDIAVNVTEAEEARALQELDKTSPAKVIALSALPPQVSETTLARDENPEVEAIRMQQKHQPKAEPLPPKDTILLQAVDALKAITVIPAPAPTRVEPAVPILGR